MKKAYENYPMWIVIVSNLVFLSVYFAGIYILYLVHPLLALLLFIYLVYMETAVYREGCVSCYYYGKVCAFGRGKIAKTFLKKGDPKKFLEKDVSFKDFIPHSLPSLVPLVAGIYLLIKSFNWFILILTIWPLIVMFFGNPIIYGELACQSCKQAKIGCPVCKFFMERAKNENKRRAKKTRKSKAS